METNTTQAGDARRDTLVEAHKNAGERHRRIREEATTHLRTTMARWLERLCVSDALTVGSVIVDFAVKLEFPPDARGYKDSIEAYFRPDWVSECRAEGGKRRFLEIVFNTVRLAVGRGHDAMVAKVAGRFAERLSEIEADLLDFGWDAYDAAEREMNTARDAVRMYDAKCAAAEYERKAQAVRARLARNVKIDVFAKSAPGRCDAVRTVEWVSPKCLFFRDGNKKRVSLPDALKMLVNGEWQIVD